MIKSINNMKRVFVIKNHEISVTCNSCGAYNDLRINTYCKKCGKIL